MRWLKSNEARSTELAVIISYPTIASGIIVLSKTPTNKISRILPDFICKKTDFQLVFNFEQTRRVGAKKSVISC